MRQTLHIIAWTPSGPISSGPTPGTSGLGPISVSHLVRSHLINTRFQPGVCANTKLPNRFNGFSPARSVDVLSNLRFQI
jgi:hypothetical protein